MLVADFGTAATFDLLDEGGRFAGGAIAPGLRTLATALSQGTALLPVIESKPPRTMMGKNTRDALRSGLCGVMPDWSRICWNNLGQTGGRLFSPAEMPVQWPSWWAKSRG